MQCHFIIHFFNWKNVKLFGVLLSIEIVFSVRRLFTETMMSIDNKMPKSFILTVVVRSSCEILKNPSFLSHLYSLSLAKQIWCPGGSVPWCNVYLILTYSMEVTIVKFKVWFKNLYFFHFTDFFSSFSGKTISNFKDVHIIVPFAYLSSSYSKFEWAENVSVQARTKIWAVNKFAVRPVVSLKAR